MTGSEQPRVVACGFLTPGVGALLALSTAGFLVTVYRFVFGLAAVTNLDQQHPWGLWIAIDVATGVALAAGGFTTAGLAYIVCREQFRAITRPALLTAMLGYTFVVLGLVVDLGRYYNIWHPVRPSMWQVNSVLFEVAMCVMCYLIVLYVEFLPAVCERFINDMRRPRLARWCGCIQRTVNRTMILFIIAGVVLSCLHQSSLGNLMVIAPSKMHPLWFTPILPLLFLLSAIAVGFPMVIFESVFAAWALKLKPELNLLSGLARYVPVFLGAYIAFKAGDLLIRESAAQLVKGSVQSLLFMIEVLVGLIIPFVMFLSARVRCSVRWLFVASLLTVLGVLLNRVNVFLTAYQPPYAVKPYFPSIGEFAVTAGLVSALILVYRLTVTHVPVITQPVGARRG